MGKKQYLNLFDIVGPVMIGPSSSHTAGAAKIGYAAYQLLGEQPKKIRIKLYNSFADTGEGHKTDLALLGGTLGIEPDNEDLIKAKDIARQKNVDYKIKSGYHSPDLHPNTAVIDLWAGKKKASLVGQSIGGGRISISKVNTRNIEADSGPNKLAADSTSFQETYYSFQFLKQESNTATQLLNLILSKQTEVTGLSKVEILTEFEKRWQIMVRSIQVGISDPKRAENNMFGGDSYRISRSKLRVLSPVIENGIIYAIGVSEYNAKMGKIVAAPTAGAAGILPGTLRSMQEKFSFSDRKMAEALTVAAAIGAVVANKVELAGAVAGCQAEIGVAGAMTAAAGAYLIDADVEKIEAAASLVLANLLGLTCDPVMGLVEVPCILRNGMVTSMAFAAIELAGDNVKYTIPFDEVIEVVKKVGADMRPIYKETSQGGLAQTETAQRACQKCSRCG